LPFVFTWALALCLASAFEARAQAGADDERAESHFHAATSHFEEESFEEALREFEAAYRLSGRPELLYNVALTRERLGRWEEAADTYDRFIEAAPDHPAVETARERRDRARRRAEAGAARQPPGRDPPMEGEPLEARPASGERGPSLAPWIVLGSSAAVGLASLATGLVAHGIAEDLARACPDGVCPTAREGDANTGEALAVTSTVLTFAAAAGAVASLVLFLLDLDGSSDADAEAPAAELELTPLPGGGLIGARGRL
jgi:tetratricopeptide (TPR) repeat protein